MASPKKKSGGFPLTARSDGRFCKKIKGKIYYFGDSSDPAEALRLYHFQLPFIAAGKVPPVSPDDVVGGPSIAEVVESYLEIKKNESDSGEIMHESYRTFRRFGNLLASIAGETKIESLTPEVLLRIRQEASVGVGVVALRNRVGIFKRMLAHSEMMGCQPIKWGNGFKPPSRSAIRKDRAKKGIRLHSAKHLNSAIRSAKAETRAMIYLGINCAFNNIDCCRLKWSHLDLDGRWHRFNRMKTGIPRRAKLWEETVDALKAVPKSGGDLVFVHPKAGVHTTQSIHRMCLKHDIKFSYLRRTFRTVAERAGKTIATRIVMGHASTGQDMDMLYVQTVPQSDFEIVSKHVREWLLRDEGLDAFSWDRTGFFSEQEPQDS